jgi:hypothetical protein
MPSVGRVVQTSTPDRRQHAADNGSHLGIVVDDQDVELAKAVGRQGGQTRISAVDWTVKHLTLLARATEASMRLARYG